MYFTPPQFTDCSGLSGLELTDPTNPARSVYFLVRDHEIEDVADYVTIIIVDNSDHTKI